MFGEYDETVPLPMSFMWDITNQNRALRLKPPKPKKSGKKTKKSYDPSRSTYFDYVRDELIRLLCDCCLQTFLILVGCICLCLKRRISHLLASPE